MAAIGDGPSGLRDGKFRYIKERAGPIFPAKII
jgi:hypothetical protein